jgi:hypothetical protein
MTLGRRENRFQRLLLMLESGSCLVGMGGGFYCLVTFVTWSIAKFRGPMPMTFAIAINNLRVQVIQTVHWSAGYDGFQGQQHRSSSTKLVDYKVDVSHLPQWNPANHKGGHGDYIVVNNDNSSNQYGLQPAVSSFQVPPDALD